MALLESLAQKQAREDMAQVAKEALARVGREQQARWKVGATFPPDLTEALIRQQGIAKAKRGLASLRIGQGSMLSQAQYDAERLRQQADAQRRKEQMIQYGKVLW